MELFVTCAGNLEPYLAQELADLGYPQVVTGFRGVRVPDVTFDAIYKINYCSRLAGRVLLPISRFRCIDERSLYDAVYKIDWLRYLNERNSIAIDANVSHPRLRNSLYCAQIAKDAICDQLRQRVGDRPTVDLKCPDVQLNLYIHDDWAVFSYDTSGTPLHKRGYRQENVEAPLQETLAAALLTVANFQGTEVFCDPCCGSGTILIEAALMATKTPPGFLRTRWGFLHHPEHSQERWLKVKIEADQKKIPLEPGRFFGADINKQAAHACKVNLRAVGMHHAVEVVQCDLREYEPPVPPTFVIANPPYGRRLDDVKHLVSL